MTSEQSTKAAIQSELERLLASDADHKAKLSFEEITTVRGHPLNYVLWFWTVLDTLHTPYLYILFPGVMLKEYPPVSPLCVTLLTNWFLQSN